MPCVADRGICPVEWPNREEVRRGSRATVRYSATQHVGSSCIRLPEVSLDAKSSVAVRQDTLMARWKNRQSTDNELRRRPKERSLPTQTPCFAQDRETRGN